MNLIFEQETYAIRGAILDVYGTLGSGFLEAVYQEALEKELKARGIPFKSQQLLQIDYKGEPLTQTYKVDALCYDAIILELKAVREIAPEHKAQLLNYLKASGKQLGLLVNFGHHPGCEIVRMVSNG